MTSDKETIYAALWSRLTGSVSGTVVSSRRVRHFDEVPPQEQPAMFMEQTTAQTEQDTGSPGKQVIQAKVLIYAYAEDTTGPMPTINGLMSQVEAAMRRQPTEASGPYTTTLNGQVASAKVVGIEFGGGNLGSQGIGIATIEILTTT